MDSRSNLRLPAVVELGSRFDCGDGYAVEIIVCFLKA